MRDRGDRREKSNKEARPSFPPIMSKKVWIIVMVNADDDDDVDDGD